MFLLLINGRPICNPYFKLCCPRPLFSFDIGPSLMSKEKAVWTACKTTNFVCYSHTTGASIYIYIFTLNDRTLFLSMKIVSLYYVPHS